jgi:hypothetical protein
MVGASSSSPRPRCGRRQLGTQACVLLPQGQQLPRQPATWAAGVSHARAHTRTAGSVKVVVQQGRRRNAITAWGCQAVSPTWDPGYQALPRTQAHIERRTTLAQRGPTGVPASP